MSVLISRPKLNELMKEFEVSEAKIKEIVAWMNEHVDEVSKMTELAENAESEIDGVEDDELFEEVAYLFESVIDYGDDDDEEDDD